MCRTLPDSSKIERYNRWGNATTLTLSLSPAWRACRVSYANSHPRITFHSLSPPTRLLFLSHSHSADKSVSEVIEKMEPLQGACSFSHQICQPTLPLVGPMFPLQAGGILCFCQGPTWTDSLSLEIADLESRSKFLVFRSQPCFFPNTFLFLLPVPFPLVTNKNVCLLYGNLKKSCVSIFYRLLPHIAIPKVANLSKRSSIVFLSSLTSPSPQAIPLGFPFMPGYWNSQSQQRMCAECPLFSVRCNWQLSPVHTSLSLPCLVSHEPKVLWVDYHFMAHFLPAFFASSV